MTREEAKDYINQQDPSIYLSKAKKTGYICPSCNNGTGREGTGITKQKGKNTYHCFVCGLHEDNIGLIGKTFNIGEFKAQLDKGIEIYGLTVEERKTTENATKTPPVKKLETPTQQEEEKPADFMDYYKACKDRNDYKYLQDRGISQEIQDKFYIGLNETKDRIIVPTSRGSYIARALREETQPKVKATGKRHIFNLQAIKDNNEIFIVEGEIDALSIEELGYKAMGLGGTSNLNLLVESIKAKSENKVFIVMLDNDEKQGTSKNPGQEAQAKLVDLLSQNDIAFIEAGYHKDKDANDFLLRDREAFRDYLEENKQRAIVKGKELKGNMYKAIDLLSYFITGEGKIENYEASTGFETLDKNLNGGLHEGLYVVGAISSLGKTTFTLQLADQVATSGRDVIFFSLEMSKYELMAKSISRYTFKAYPNEKQENGVFIARDTQQVLKMPGISSKFNKKENDAMIQAFSNYRKQADHLYIYEGRYKGHRLGVQDIRQIVGHHKRTTGQAPLVIVDYLQILAPVSERASDKQNTDGNIFELKEISRDFSIPVIAISSFNRDNYTEPVSLVSFKESGAIEYSSDILFGLQYRGMDRVPGESEKDRDERIRNLVKDIQRKKRDKEPIDIELKCLKYRNGTLFTVELKLLNAFNYFEEVTSFGVLGLDELPFEEEEKPTKKVIKI